MKAFYIALLFLFTFNLFGQTQSVDNQEIQVLYGTSAQKNIHTQQFLVSYGKYFNTPESKNLKISYKIDFEYLDDFRKNSIVLLGLGGGFKQILLNSKNFSFILDSYIGMNYIDKNRIGDRNLGENFIFSDNIKFGLRFGDSVIPGLSIFYQFRHISNAGIYNDNMGYNSQYILFSLNLKS